MYNIQKFIQNLTKKYIITFLRIQPISASDSLLLSLVNSFSEKNIFLFLVEKCDIENDKKTNFSFSIKEDLIYYTQEESSISRQDLNE